jgi:hypothetical protein
MRSTGASGRTRLRATESPNEPRGAAGPGALLPSVTVALALIPSKPARRRGPDRPGDTRQTPRGFTEAELIEETRRNTMDELAEQTLAAEHVLVF